MPANVLLEHERWKKVKYSQFPEPLLYNDNLDHWLDQNGYLLVKKDGVSLSQSGKFFEFFCDACYDINHLTYYYLYLQLTVKIHR